MSNFAYSPEQDGSEVTAPYASGLHHIQALWAGQLTELERSGVVDQAIGWATNGEEGLCIDRSRTHIYVDVDPGIMPWGDAAPESFLAFNGLMLSGARLDEDGYSPLMLPVPIGMYFRDDYSSYTGAPAFGCGDLSTAPRTVIGGFEDEFGELLHEKALAVHFEASLNDWPLDGRLSLSPNMMNIAFAPS